MTANTTATSTTATNTAATSTTRHARRLVGGLRIAIAAAATVGVLAIGIGSAGAAASRDVDVRYRVSYGALPMGRVDANVRIDPGAYAMSARFKSGGLAKLMKKTEGNASASGAIGKAGPVPKSFKIGYRSGKKKRSRAVSFAGGAVKAASESPKRKPPKNWVPALPEHLKNAIDPASAFLVSAPGGNPCASKARLFDGRTRIDTTMRSLGEHRFRAKGYRGTAHKCAVSVAPVAGYKPGKSAERMRSLKGMTASFVPVPGTDLHMLVALEVPTPIGKFTAKATRLDLGA